MVQIKKIAQGALFIVGLVIIMSIFIGNSCMVSAETEVRSKSYVDSWLFAIPEGGWSSIRAKVTYSEDYVTTGERIYYTERSRSVVYTPVGATETPGVQLGNISHSTGKIFQAWEKGSLWMSSDWEHGYIYINKETVSYLRGKAVTGNLPFLVICNGAVAPTRSGSVQMSLKYK